MVADLFSRILVQRHPVTKAAPFWVRSAREEALVGGMGAGDSRMARSRKHGNVASIGGQFFQIGARFEVASGFFRKKELGQYAHVRFDSDHPAWDLCRLGRPQGAHGVQQREPDRDPGSTEESTAGQSSLRHRKDLRHDLVPAIEIIPARCVCCHSEVAFRLDPGRGYGITHTASFLRHERGESAWLGRSKRQSEGGSVTSCCAGEQQPPFNLLAAVIASELGPTGGW